MNSRFEPSDCNILVVDDDQASACALAQHLKQKGFQVSVQAAVDSAHPLHHWNDHQLILLDRLGGSSLELLKSLRDLYQVHTPLILMSAQASVQERIQAFDLGADGYLAKPFTLAEMDAHIRALLRRIAHERNRSSSWNALDFTPVEQRLLNILLANTGKVLSKALLYQQVLHKPYSQQDRALDMHISHLRRKLRERDINRHIRTVWGKGYVLSATRERRHGP